jgi:hypothetical protein
MGGIPVSALPPEAYFFIGIAAFCKDPAKTKLYLRRRQRGSQAKLSPKSWVQARIAKITPTTYSYAEGGAISIHCDENCSRSASGTNKITTQILQTTYSDY